MKILFFKYCLIEPLFSWDANVSCFIPYGRGPFIPSKVQVFGSCERFQRNVWEKKRRKTAPHIQSRDSHKQESFRCVIDITPVIQNHHSHSGFSIFAVFGVKIFSVPFVLVSYYRAPQLPWAVVWIDWGIPTSINNGLKIWCFCLPKKRSSVFQKIEGIKNKNKKPFLLFTPYRSRKYFQKQKAKDIY